MGQLDGKVALVTGASRGIGTAIAERFASAGAAVAVSARTVDATDARLPGTIGDTVARIEAAGGTASAHRADLAHAMDRQDLIESVLDRHGTIDILVNNAAVTYFTPITEFSARRFALMFEVQVTAPTHLAQLVIPTMRTRGHGWILNISSIAACHPRQPYQPRAMRGGTVYGMCKAALERFTSGLAAELQNADIAVNSLAPNRVVPTPGTVFHQLTTENDPESEPPSVMADAALELCYRPATEMTGRIAYSADLLRELGHPAAIP
ncbi:short-subunit dehydrogenase [Tamaricihabitans halophyticus]|uniref:Short-subunit dehydrogenase n=1 Tax=Tamaricihabitans halophyticus TaxID=1262583 RepID=A0A4R2QCQ5_9PSEU|nr:SDR family NAD(P)-dependent oxidoreductase [Tamaricihabitans halophyticus]TCP46813.1 short-subunit dehydrogenase [Tamaricihabitans halophyticus]